MACEAANQENTNECVYCANDRNSFDGLEAGGNGDVVIHHGSEKVGIDSQNNNGTDKFNTTEKPLEALEASDV